MMRKRQGKRSVNQHHTHTQKTNWLISFPLEIELFKWAKSENSTNKEPTKYTNLQIISWIWFFFLLKTRKKKKIGKRQTKVKRATNIYTCYMVLLSTFFRCFSLSFRVFSSFFLVWLIGESRSNVQALEKWAGTKWLKVLSWTGVDSASILMRAFNKDLYLFMLLLFILFDFKRLFCFLISRV